MASKERRMSVLDCIPLHRKDFNGPLSGLSSRLKKLTGPNTKEHHIRTFLDDEHYFTWIYLHFTRPETDEEMKARKENKPSRDIVKLKAAEERYEKELLIELQRKYGKDN